MKRWLALLTVCLVILQMNFVSAEEKTSSPSTEVNQTSSSEEKDKDVTDTSEIKEWVEKGKDAQYKPISPEEGGNYIVRKTKELANIIKGTVESTIPNAGPILGVLAVLSILAIPIVGLKTVWGYIYSVGVLIVIGLFLVFNGGDMFDGLVRFLQS